MKFLLAAVNAKYIHSNLGIYSLRSYALKHLKDLSDRFSVGLGEYTINHNTDHILESIYRQRPDVVGFSCYIWNINSIMDLVRDLHKVLPEVKIWLGGPEVSYNAEEILRKEPNVCGIMMGEGEETFTRLVESYVAGDGCLEAIAGLAYRDEEGNCRVNGCRTLMDLDRIPFPYEDLDDFENRIIYYESSRGCPFSCSYCLSSIDKSVRFRSVDLVKRELAFFLDRKVPQVKFVDRTFNCKKSHSMEIWKYIAGHDNGVTNFHFEISADLLGEEELLLMSGMRPGLIQLEIGVQSTYERTIREIRRTMDLKQLSKVVERINHFHNIHQHLDLIAGLPYEDYSRFAQSFNEVYAMRPEQLQLGFLKVLKGSHMEEMAAEYGLSYRHRPPYEVLSTRWLSYGEVIRLKSVEEMVELFYNSGQFVHTLERLVTEFESPFAMFEEMAGYYERCGKIGIPGSRLAKYEWLYRFITKTIYKNVKTYKDLLMFDLYLRENVKSRPSFAEDQAVYKTRIKEFFIKEAEKPEYLFGYEGYDSKQISKMAHIEGMSDGRLILFDYKNRDPLTYNARFVELSLSTEEGEN